MKSTDRWWGWAVLTFGRTVILFYNLFYYCTKLAVSLFCNIIYYKIAIDVCIHNEQMRSIPVYFTKMILDCYFYFDSFLRFKQLLYITLYKWSTLIVIMVFNLNSFLKT